MLITAGFVLVQVGPVEVVATLVDDVVVTTVLEVEDVAWGELDVEDVACVELDVDVDVDVLVDAVPEVVVAPVLPVVEEGMLVDVAALASPPSTVPLLDEPEVAGCVIVVVDVTNEVVTAPSGSVLDDVTVTTLVMVDCDFAPSDTPPSVGLTMSSQLPIPRMFAQAVTTTANAAITTNPEADRTLRLRALISRHLSSPCERLLDFA